MLVSSLNCFPRIYEVSGPRHAIWASPTPSKPSRPRNVLFLLGKVNIEGLHIPVNRESVTAFYLALLSVAIGH